MTQEASPQRKGKEEKPAQGVRTFGWPIDRPVGRKEKKTKQNKITNYPGYPGYQQKTQSSPHAQYTQQLQEQAGKVVSNISVFSTVRNILKNKPPKRIVNKAGNQDFKVKEKGNQQMSLIMLMQLLGILKPPGDNNEEGEQITSPRKQMLIKLRNSHSNSKSK